MKIPGVFSKKIKITDLHSDRLDGAEYYQKIMPSAIRQKVLDECVRTNRPELHVLINIVIDHFEG